MKAFTILAAVTSSIVACNSPQSGKIQVTGQASLKVVPDIVEVSLKASNTRPAMKDAVHLTQSAINEILNVCHQYIPDKEDIKVSNIATNKEYNYDRSKPVFTGYSAEQVLEVRLKDITKLEAFSEALLATKITSIDNVRYNHSKADSIQRVVNLMALQDAQKTAQKMCGQMQVKLGSTIFLSNYSPGGERTGNTPSTSSDYDLNLYSKGFAGRGFKMTAEILNFQDVAFAGFALKE